MLMLAAGAACTRSDEPAKHTVKIDKSGTYTLGELTVHVPDGAVKVGTRLTMIEPKSYKPASSLFKASSTFDLSFEGGAQPLKPLTIELKLQGKFLPAGVRPDQALLYTPAPNGDGWRLLPAIVEGDVLKAQVPHLSPKTVSYLLDEPLRGIVSPSLLGTPQDGDCKTEVKTNELGKVKISGMTGWSTTKPDSPIRACLNAAGKTAMLSVSNRVEYILSVAATKGVKFDVGGETTDDERYTIELAKQLFNNKATQAFLPRRAVLDAQLTASNLPATVELRAEPNVFLAEAIWGSLKFLASIATGEDLTTSVKRARALLDIQDVVSCLGNAAKLGKDIAKMSFYDFYEIVASKCGETVLRVMGGFADPMTFTEKFFGRFFAVVEGVKLGWTTVMSALEGVRMQIVGTLQIKVTRIVPCLTAKEVKAIAQLPGNAEVFRVWCSDNWIVADANSYLEDYGTWGDGYSIALEWKDGRWVYYMGGSSGLTGDSYVCRNISPDLRRKICTMLPA